MAVQHDRLRALAAVGLLGIALFAAACGTPKNGVLTRDRIAIVNWQTAEKAHPDYAKLEQGEKILKDLVTRRQKQEQLAKAQMGSLAKLRGLRQVSKQNYFEADFNTRMYEVQQRENARLQKVSAVYAAEIEEQLGPRRREIEDTYQLRIFNLRAKLDNVRMKPEERKQAEEELAQLQHERGAKIGAIQAEKQAMLDEKMQAELAIGKENMQKAAEGLRAQASESLASDDERDDSLLKKAQPALEKALAIMDQEIDKQQEKNDRLRQSIADDIANEAVRLAHEKRYTVVLKQVKINLRADDITDSIVQSLKNKKENK